MAMSILSNCPIIANMLFFHNIHYIFMFNAHLSPICSLFGCMIEHFPYSRDFVVLSVSRDFPFFVSAHFPYVKMTASDIFKEFVSFLLFLDIFRFQGILPLLLFLGTFRSRRPQMTSGA